MSEIKHTPGEWKTNGGMTVKVFGRGIVANTPLPKDGGCFECVANARLIAAAPDLLAALSLLLKRYTEMVVITACDSWNAEDEAEVIDACAAIAKATGKP